MRFLAILLVAFFGLLWGSVSHAALLRTHACLDVDSSKFLVNIPFIDAFYDYKNSNDIIYLILATMLPSKTILDTNDTTNKYTTLHSQLNFFDGVQKDQYYRFCDYVTNVLLETYIPDFENPPRGDTSYCPLSPRDRFSIVYIQPEAKFSGITSFLVRFLVLANDAALTVIGCAELYVTPQFPNAVSIAINAILPAVMILLMAVHYCGEFLSPYKEARANCFLNRVSSICNRLYLNHMTPSPMVYIQYIQFAFFSAGLNLLYPGYFQPIMSFVNWCALMTVDLTSRVVAQNVNNNGHIYLDYYDDGLSGITVFTQNELQTYGWRSFMVWSLVVAAFQVTMSMIVISFCWLVHRLKPDSNFSTGFFQKLVCYITGQVAYIYYVVFSSPFLVLSLYQFSKFTAKAPDTEAFPSVFGFILMLVWALGIFIFLAKYVFGKSRPKLYTSVTLNNLFGFLYYEYRPSRLNFVAYEYGFLFARAVVVACIQRSGTAQVILLVLLEMWYTLLILACRPYYSAARPRYTNKKRERNKRHREAVGLCVVRLIVLALNIPFIRSLVISERLRSYVGFVQLLLHACVIVYFFIAGIYTLTDVLRSRSDVNFLIQSFPLVARRLEKAVLGEFNETIDEGSHDLFYRSPDLTSTFEPDTEVKSPNPLLSVFSPIEDTDFFGRRKNVDYSVREADLYMRGVNSPQLEGPWEPDTEIQRIWNRRDGNLNSVNPMVKSDEEESGLKRVKGWFLLGLGRPKRFEPVEPQTSGFQVRRPKNIVVKDVAEVRHLMDHEARALESISDYKEPQEAYTR